MERRFWIQAATITFLCGVASSETSREARRDAAPQNSMDYWFKPEAGHLYWTVSWFTPHKAGEGHRAEKDISGSLRQLLMDEQMTICPSTLHFYLRCLKVILQQVQQLLQIAVRPINKNQRALQQRSEHLDCWALWGKTSCLVPDPEFTIQIKKFWCFTGSKFRITLEAWSYCRGRAHRYLDALLITDMREKRDFLG